MPHRPPLPAAGAPFGPSGTGNGGQRAPGTADRACRNDPQRRQPRNRRPRPRACNAWLDRGVYSNTEVRERYDSLSWPRGTGHRAGPTRRAVLKARPAVFLPGDTACPLAPQVPRASPGKVTSPLSRDGDRLIETFVVSTPMAGKLRTFILNGLGCVAWPELRASLSSRDARQDSSGTGPRRGTLLAPSPDLGARRPTAIAGGPPRGRVLPSPRGP